MKNSKKTPSAPRGIEALTAIFHCKGGPMGDRRTKRNRTRGDQRRAALRDGN